MTPITVNLPKTNQTGKAEYSDVEDNDVALKKGVEEAGEQIDAISGITWYTPKVIATEESRESASYGTLTTADEIKSVVLPENGLLLVGYIANVKCSVAEAGKAAIFLGSNQLKGHLSGAPTVQEAEALQTTFREITTFAGGLKKQANESAAQVTTGQVLGSLSTAEGGFCVIFAAAGTYNISVKFKATSGSITAKERRLYVATLG